MNIDKAFAEKLAPVLVNSLPHIRLSSFCVHFIINLGIVYYVRLNYYTHPHSQMHQKASYTFAYRICVM